MEHKSKENLFTPYGVFEKMNHQNSDDWWNSQTNEVKSLFVGMAFNTTPECHYQTFWFNLDQSVKKNIHMYCLFQSGDLEIGKDDTNSLLMEIICDLADLELVREYNISLDEMTDQEGCFYEEYQDRFNDMYDDIETRILDN